MRKIAAAIISFNEEKNIERCIKGLLNCVDEIVVLDSYSTDRTKEICHQYKVRFIQDKWEGYAQTKNKLNDLIDADYIFSIDADEVPCKTLQSEILKLKELENNHVYVLNRITNYCGQWIRYCGWYPEYKMRIFPKSKARWEGEFVHERLTFDKSIDVTHLKGHLEHYSYYNTKEHQERAKKYALLGAQQYYKQGKKYSFYQSSMSALAKYVNILILKKGILDGRKGFQIAKISAAANYLKYEELKKLSRSNKQ